MEMGWQKPVAPCMIVPAKRCWRLAGGSILSGGWGEYLLAQQ